MVEAAWLAEQLAAGRSIESIAREVGKKASTVSYWGKKHGLRSTHAAQHAPQGGIRREVLEELIARNLSVRQIADEIGLSATTVRYWLRRLELSTTTLARRRAAREELRGICPEHGEAV